MRPWDGVSPVIFCPLYVASRTSAWIIRGLENLLSPKRHNFGCGSTANNHSLVSQAGWAAPSGRRMQMSPSDGKDLFLGVYWDRKAMPVTTRQKYTQGLIDLMALHNFYSSFFKSFIFTFFVSGLLKIYE